MKGLDYNTQRSKLIMSEYGREIQSMAKYACQLPERRQRQAAARTIVAIMKKKAPQLKQMTDGEHAVWDHLYMISEGRLDIEWPFNVQELKTEQPKPEKIKIPKQNNDRNLMRYGLLVGKVLNHIKKMPEGESRAMLTSQTANLMKRHLMVWSDGYGDEERVISDIARLSDGAIQLDPHKFRFANIEATSMDEQRRKKKKKRK